MFKVSFICCVMLPLGLTCAVAQEQKNTMTSGRPSATLNAEQCQQVWNNAVPSGEYLDKANAGPFIVNFKQADGPDQDGKISQSEFEAACSKGLVKFTER